MVAPCLFTPCLSLKAELEQVPDFIADFLSFVILAEILVHSQTQTNESEEREVGVSAITKAACQSNSCSTAKFGCCRLEVASCDETVEKPMLKRGSTNARGYGFERF